MGIFSRKPTAQFWCLIALVVILVLNLFVEVVKDNMLLLLIPPAACLVLTELTLRQSKKRGKDA